jgi:hypothetical protein
MNRYIIAAALFAAAIALWSLWPRPVPVVGESVPLPPAKEVVTVERVRTEVKVVYVYPDKVKAKLDLPKSIQQDASKQVTATGKLHAEERPYTLTAVLDTDTGISEVYARPDPLPWFGPGKRAEVGLAYGIKDGEPTARLYASRDLIRVKALHAGVMATLDHDGESFAGGFISMRF